LVFGKEPLYNIYDVYIWHKVNLNDTVKSFQVLGNAKGAVAVVISILIFKNPISMVGMFGYALTVIGVILYSETKKRYSKN